MRRPRQRRRRRRSTAGIVHNIAQQFARDRAIGPNLIRLQSGHRRLALRYFLFEFVVAHFAAPNCPIARVGGLLGFGIGIAHGFATLGTIGFEGRFDYAAIGTVSNVASRLCDEAKPGQILISPRVRQAVDEAVTVEPVGEFTLKGIRRPMMAYNVLAA